MAKFTKMETPVSGLFEVVPQVFSDGRGYFVERWNIQALLGIGIDLTNNLKQGNESCSQKGTLRGMHFQFNKPQGKFVWVVQGEAFDAVIDIRPGSKTFGKWYGLVLSEQNFKALYMPPGFAHGFLVLSDSAKFQYLVFEGEYYPKDEGGIIWNDPDIGIQWPLHEYGLTEASILLSEKDRQWPKLGELKL